MNDRPRLIANSVWTMLAPPVTHEETICSLMVGGMAAARFDDTIALRRVTATSLCSISGCHLIFAAIL